MQSSQSPAGIAPALPVAPTTNGDLVATPVPQVTNSASRVRSWVLVHHQDLIALTALVLVIALKTWERVSWPEWLGRTDILNQYLPWWSYLGHELRSGNIPGWNPYQLAGTPFLGDPQSGWGYLPVMIPFALFPALTAIKVYIVLQLLIGGLSTYGFARIHRFAPVAALGAALAYVLGPFLTYNTYCCNIQGHAATWIPAGLIGIELAIQANTWNRRLAGWAICGCAFSQILAGWMGQGAYLSMVLFGGYLVYRVFTREGRLQFSAGNVRWLMIHSAFLLLICGGLGAAAILPRIDVIQYTNLDMGGYQDDGSPSGAALDTVLRRILGPDFAHRRTTIGAGTLALALMGAILAWRRPPVPFFVLQSLVVLILTMRPTPLHQLFYLLPHFQSIHDHAPYRAFGVLMIGPAMLAAAGIEAIPRLRRPTGWLAAVIPFVALGLIVAGMAPEDRTLARIGPGTLFAFGLITLLVLAAVLIRRSPDGGATGIRLIPMALLFVIVLEPGLRDTLWHIRTNPVDPETLPAVYANISPDDADSAGDWLQRKQGDSVPPFRYVGYNAIDLRTLANMDGIVYQNRHFSPRYRRLLIGPRSMFLRLYALQGYNPVQLTNTVDLMTTINGHPLEYHDAHVMASGMSSPWLDVMGVQFVIVPPNVPPGRPDLLHLNQQWPVAFDDGRVRVLENPDAFPRGWLVHATQVAPQSIALARIESGSADPAEVAILEPGDVTPDLAVPANPEEESVTIERFSADAMTFTVRAQEPGIVVIGEIYNPGWSAWVDGERVEILQVDGVLRGVPVSRGHHQVELRYEPRSISAGIGLTGLTIVLVMAGLAVTNRRREPDAG